MKLTDEKKFYCEHQELQGVWHFFHFLNCNLLPRICKTFPIYKFLNVVIYFLFNLMWL